MKLLQSTKSCLKCSLQVGGTNWLKSSGVPDLLDCSIPSIQPTPSLALIVPEILESCLLPPDLDAKKRRTFAWTTRTAGALEGLLPEPKEAEIEQNSRLWKGWFVAATRCPDNSCFILPPLKVILVLLFSCTQGAVCYFLSFKLPCTNVRQT